MKQKSVSEANSRNVEEIVVPLEKRQKILNDLRKNIKEKNTTKCLNQWMTQVRLSLWQENGSK